MKILEGDRSVLARRPFLQPDNACFKLGPFQVCLDALELIESARAARHPRGKTRVLVRKHWPEQDQGCGLVLWSRPFAEDSKVVFQVATQRRGVLGPRPKSSAHAGRERRSKSGVRAGKQRPPELATPAPIKKNF